MRILISLQAALLATVSAVGQAADTCAHPPQTDPVPLFAAHLLAPGQATVSPEAWQEYAPVHREMLGNIARSRAAGLPSISPATCFTPGYSAKAVAEFERSVWGDVQRDFRIFNRWTSTATNGSVSNGVPMTLTYSFVTSTAVSIPGGAQGAGEPASNNELVAFLEVDCGYTTAEWKQLFRGIFDRYEVLTGITYVEVSDDAATFISSPGALGLRGDIRIAAHSIDGQTGGNVLAYNFFPNTGDMVLDSDNISLYANRTNNSLLFRNVLAHEHGHGLGYSHVCPVNQSKLMEPFVSTNFDGPQDDDIQGLQRQYADTLEPNQTAATATALGTVNSTANVSDVSIGSTSDTDFYSFTIPLDGTVNLTMTPIGSSYLEGLQNGDGSCTAGTLTDSRINSNLALTLLNSAGSSTIASASDNPGAAETITGAALTAGSYRVRVSPGVTDNIQRYTLGISYTATPITTTDVAVTKTDGKTTINSPASQSYTITVTNTGNAADGTVVTDTIPSQMTGAAWSVVYAGGAAGAANGAGNVNLTITSFPSGSSATITLTGSITAGLPSGVLSNTAGVTLPLAVGDSNTGNNSATDTTAINGGIAGDPRQFETFATFTSIDAVGEVSPSGFSGKTWREGDSSITSSGFLRSAGGPDGNGFVSHDGPEDGYIELDSQFTGFNTAQRTHQMAALIQFTGSTDPTGSTVVVGTVVGNGNFPAYEILMGTNGTTSPPISIRRWIDTSATASSTSITSPTHVASTFFRVVVQYEAPSTATGTDGGFHFWVSPTTSAQAPNVRRGSGVTSGTGIVALGGTAVAEPTNGFLIPGNVVLGTSAFPAAPLGPTVGVDSIALWDGPADLTGPDTVLLQKALDWFNRDVVSPTVILGSVSTPMNSAVTSISANFSESVVGFDIGDISLTRGAVPVSLATASITGGPQNHTINLATTTAADGAYILTLNGPGGITDFAANPFSGSPTRAWTMDATRPTATPVNPSPTQRESSLPSYTVNFSETMNFSSATVNSFTLSRDGTPLTLNAGNSSLSNSASSLTINLNASLTSTPGSYLVSCLATGVGTDLAGNTVQFNPTANAFSISVGDGITDATEDGAPNAGDGNNDGIKDKFQTNVASIPDANGGEYITLAASTGTLNSITTSTNPGGFATPPVSSEFPAGFVSFVLTGVGEGGSATVDAFYATALDPAITRYYKFGPSAPAAANSLYNFLFAGAPSTGGERISSTQFRLHLKDGALGDSDWFQNGTIVDPGGPTVNTPLYAKLETFTATAPAYGQPVSLIWTTSAEIDSVGFNVYRATAEGRPGTIVNEGTIPSAGENGTGASYGLIDRDGIPFAESRNYLLEEIDASGKKSLFGPAPTRINTTTSAVTDWTLF